VSAFQAVEKENLGSRVCRVQTLVCGSALNTRGLSNGATAN
jgi:hypothetical protein